MGHLLRFTTDIVSAFRLHNDGKVPSSPVRKKSSHDRVAHVRNRLVGVCRSVNVEVRTQTLVVRVLVRRLAPPLVQSLSIRSSDEPARRPVVRCLNMV